ncbi:glycosyltransferase family 4 protein [Flavobacterium sp.]|uniref:glycosyltransferase family 4 protein n=1 Tax=Flavobacterium sp. TaxID=239 RepID=UPI0037BF9B84
MQPTIKKILIVTYYWPPAGGPGVQRWLKFVKYLPDFGIQPIVYIPENPTYPIVDEQLVAEVSKDVIIVKQKIKEPYRLAAFFSKKNTQKISSGIIPNKKKQGFMERLLLWVRGNLFIPDARVLWVKPSVAFLETYMKEHSIDVLITTGPPHSLHLIGLALQEKVGVKWVADFRDPWTTIGYHKDLNLSPKAEQKHKQLERTVLQKADLILVTSPTTQKEFQAITLQPIEVITNGYDTEKIDKQPLDEKFTLAHIGSLLSERNPKILWKVLQELCNEYPQFKADFQLKLIGKVSQEVLDSLQEFHLIDHLTNLGYLSHLEAVTEQRKSQVLLLIEIDRLDTRCIIPGKLFEYLVSERPIIGIGPKDSDFATILKETNTGVFFEYAEQERLKALLLSYYHLYLEKNLKVNPVGLQQYSRKSLTEKLVQTIQKI